jgi:hypothetical protein
MTTPWKFIPVTLSLGALMVVAACDLGKVTNQATASAVAVGTVLYTPPTEVKAGALALDAGLSDLDGGVLADAGVTIPSQTIVALFFGNKGATLDTAPTGVPGATVTLTVAGGASYTLEDQGGGNYALSADAGFAYQSGATYTFTIVKDGTTYVAEVEQAPDIERISAFHPAAGYVELNAGEAFRFTRPDPPAGQELPVGFINVFPISQSGRGDPTYTNLPSTPLQFLKLVVAPGDWKKQAVEIPGTAFPNPGTNYLVVLQSAKLGGPKSDNLFTGSPVLAGAADVAIVKTR